MASAAAPMTILPQYQGTAYQLQQQQALAQALMQHAMTPQNTQAVGSGQYTVVPKYSIGGGIAQLGQALMAAKMQNNVAQGYQDLGQNQMNYLMGGAPTQQAATPQAAAPQTDAGGMTDNQSGPGVTSTPVPTPGQPTPQAYASALGASGSATPAAAPAQSGGMLAPGSALNPSGMDAGKAAYLYMTIGPAEYAKNFVAPYVKPTDTTLAAHQAGYTSEQVQQANAGRIFKDNFVAPITGTGTFRDPQTLKPVAYNAPDIPGTRQLYDAAGNSAGVAPLQGAQAALQGNAAATAAGNAQFKPVQVYNPNTKQMEYTNEAAVTNPGASSELPGLAGIFAQQESSGGKTAPDNPLQIQQGTFNQYAKPGQSWSNPADRTAVAQNVLNTYQQKYGGDLGRIATAYFSGEGNVAPAGSPTPFLKNVSDSNGKSVASYVGDIYSRAGSGQASPSGRPAASAPMGAEKGAGNLQDELSKKYTALTAANSEAQNTTSYLQNIKDLASRAAVGPQSDRLNYVNGLLSLAGSEKATDAVTANDLLNKYSGQITARLSANGMGTDAARSILQSAYPSAHMNKDAINEAADNLIGAQQMTQAKARLLTPLANARNPTDYNNAEMKFDQNADPRIFQYANIQDPTQRQAFAQKLIKQDPQIVQKIKNLEAMGAMQ